MEASVALRPRFDDFARDPAIVKSILESVESALILCDVEGRLVHLNGAAMRLYTGRVNLESEPRPGMSLSTIFGDRDGTVDEVVRACFSENEPVSRSCVLPASGNGEEARRVVLTVHPVEDGSGDRPVLAMVRVRDERGARDRVEHLNERLERTYRALELERRLSRRDTLTGLLNRREFFNALKGEMGYADRYDQPLSLVCIDIDHFKSVNDRYGHPAGDEVLKRLGAVIAQTMRRLDKPGRVGGEEFAIVLPGVSRDGAARAAERLRAAIEASPIVLQGERIAVTASFGVVEYDRGREAGGVEGRGDGLAAGTDRSSLYERGDAALYRAKERGRNRVEVG